MREHGDSSARSVAEALDLLVHASRTTATCRLTGWHDGFGITIRAPNSDHTAENGALEAEVDAGGAIPAALEVARAATVYVRSTYDDTFDRAIVVHGPKLAVAALFSIAARAAVRAAMERLPLSVSAGSVRLETAWVIGDDYAPYVVAAVRQMIALAKLLALDERTIAGRLAENARQDPEGAVRMRCWELLLEYFPDSPEAGDRWARDVLEAAGADEALRSAALEHLIGRFPASLPRTSWLMRELLRAGPRLTVALARALGVRRDGSEEGGLVDVFLKHPRAEVKLAIAGELGERGTGMAVEALSEQAKRLFADAALKAAARAAIERIRSRSGAAGPGSLSIAANTGGELSSPPGEAGALSEAEPEGSDPP